MSVIFTVLEFVTTSDGSVVGETHYVASDDVSNAANYWARTVMQKPHQNCFISNQAAANQFGALVRGEATLPWRMSAAQFDNWKRMHVGYPYIRVLDAMQQQPQPKAREFRPVRMPSRDAVHELAKKYAIKTESDDRHTISTQKLCHLIGEVLGLSE